MKKRIFIIPVITALLTISCSEWLNVVPKTMEPADVMFNTYQGYKDALTGCYLKMKDRALWGEQLTISSVEFLAQHWEFGNYTIDSTVTIGTAMKQYDYNDDHVRAIFQRVYDGLFNVIIQANTIIEAMPLTGETAIPDPQARAVVEGEAYAIRALCHFETLRLFGQVPQNATLSPIALPYVTIVSREPINYIDYDQFVASLESDLHRAAGLLGEHDPYMDYTYAQVNGSATPQPADEFLRYRILRLNYWAVKGLQARFYLYIGNTAKAAEAANEVIDASNNGKGFSMSSNAEELDIAGTLSYAGFYALPGEGLFMLSNYQLRDYNQTIFGSPSLIMEYRVHMPYTKMEGTADEFGLFGEPHAASNNNRFRGVWRQRSHPQWPITTIYELTKYDQVNATASSLWLLTRKQVMPILRLSEMYLIAMETSNNMTQINALYNTYRSARNISATEFTNKQDVMDMVEKEYRREFFGEGQMFFYYKRNNATSMVWTNRAITETNYRIPLPTTEYQRKDNF